MAVFAQPYYFKHYQIEDGLSYNSVLCSMQDRQGFMWFGTRDGLNRFDGYLFNSYKSNTADPYSLGDNYVYCIAQDTKDRIWVGTKNGLYQFDPKSERFVVESSTKNKIISELVVDKKGDVWFLSAGQLFCVNAKGPYRLFQHSDSQPLTGIAPGSDGELWLASEYGNVIRFRPQDNSFRYYDIFSKSPGVTDRRIEKIWKDEGGQLYIGTSNHGVKVLNVQDNSYSDILTFDDDHTEILARSFSSTRDKQIWIGTESGLFLYNPATGRLLNLKKNFHDPYSLSDNAVYTICHDNEGGMWVGTYFGGINYYSVTSTQFEKFFPKVAPGSLRGNLVREFCMDSKGFLWVGTEDAGLNRFDPASNTFTHVGFSGKAGSIAYNNIHGLLSVGEELWVGTYQHGLDVLDINTLKVIRHYGHGSGAYDLKTNFINVLFKDRTGVIYLGSQVGLYRYDDVTNTFIYIPETGSTYIASITEDHSGRLWVSTFGSGVYVRQPGKYRWTHFKSEPGRPGSLPSNVVTDVFEDSRHRILLCTENGGLCMLVPNESKFVKYDLPASVSDKYLFNIVEDNKRRLWITSSGGLICLDTANNFARVFTKAGGTLNDQFNYRSAFKDSQGRLYFGSSKGFIRHDPRSEMTGVMYPPLYITGLHVEKNSRFSPPTEEGNPVYMPAAQSVTLGPGNTTFSIDVAALSYASPGTITYRYKLEGLDHSWTTLAVNRRIYYTQVPAGQYVFKINAVIGDAGQSTVSRELKIRIKTPFYKSVYAVIIYGIIVVIAVLYALRLWQRRNHEMSLRKIAALEAQKEREIYQAKIDFFTHITHEIKTPLSLIKAPLEKVLQSGETGTFTNDLLLVDRNTDRLLDLVDQLLSFRRTEIDGYSLNFNRTDVSSLLLNLCSLFKESAQRLTINLTSDFPVNNLIAYVDQDAFNKILSNLLSNAIKYAEKNICVTLETIDVHEFSITVRNDGLTLPTDTAHKIFEPFVRSEVHKNKPGTGIGLSLAKALAELHQGTLEYFLTRDGLNTFRLVIPFHQPAEMNITNPGTSALYETGGVKEAVFDSKPVVLVVEDQQEVRDFIADLLADDYQVITAPDGATAKELLTEHTIQIIVSDVMMPGIDGFEFCRQVKEDMLFSHIPFILLTAKDTFAGKIEGLDCGSDAYIDKPFSPKHLRLQIRNLLKNREHIKKHYTSSPVAQLKTVSHSKADSKFIHKIDTLIKLNLARLDFDIDELAERMNMSRATLYRKVKAITTLSPVELVTITRLKTAAEMLLSGDYKIYEIAEHVGFTSSAVLGRAFQKQFGMSPTEYATKSRI